MTDDPRDILKAAGVECAEFDAWYDNESDELDAILALARLVAKYKWLFGEAQECDWNFSMSADYYNNVIVDLNRRWEEHNA